MKTPFYQLNYEQLSTLLEANHLPKSGADLLFRWHYKEKRLGPCTQDLAHKTQDFIHDQLSFDLPEVRLVQESEDQTVKFLIALSDGKTVECVLLAFQKKYTLCLSTQVGCAMGCTFCFTGTQGLTRHLTAEEIIGQFLLTWHWLKQNRPEDRPILNVVFMGQGEPLHNFDAVKKATEILLHKRGIGLAALKITISTAGYLPGLKRWVQEMPAVNLALSFHSPFSEKRNLLMPLNKNYPLEKVLEEIQHIPLVRKQYVIFEYLLIKDFNDGPEDAHATAKLVDRERTIINLIAYNPFPGDKFQRPDHERVIQFKAILNEYGLATTLRESKGIDILAACGQLNTKGL